jgi:hypothetical protein
MAFVHHSFVSTRSWVIHRTRYDRRSWSVNFFWEHQDIHVIVFENLYTILSRWNNVGSFDGSWDMPDVTFHMISMDSQHFPLNPPLGFCYRVSAHPRRRDKPRNAPVSMPLKGGFFVGTAPKFVHSEGQLIIPGKMTFGWFQWSGLIPARLRW